MLTDSKKLREVKMMRVFDKMYDALVESGVTEEDAMEQVDTMETRSHTNTRK